MPIKCLLNGADRVRFVRLEGAKYILIFLHDKNWATVRTHHHYMLLGNVIKINGYHYCYYLLIYRHECNLLWNTVTRLDHRCIFHRARGFLAGRKLLSSPKSKTYPPLPELLKFSARPACSTFALPQFAIIASVSALRTSGKVGSKPFSIARGLSFHHCSAVAAKRLLLIPKASPHVHRALGSHLRRPLRKATVLAEVVAKNFRSKLSARPDASPSLRQSMRSGHPIADRVARSSGLGEPSSLMMSDSCSIGVSPVRHGAL